MYLLSASDPERAAHLRAHLAQLGSSVLVVGGPDLWRVHVHLDEPALAVDAGTMAGRVEEVLVSNLTPRIGLPEPTADARASVGVVACAQGAGLAEVFAAAGAEVVRSAPGARASTGQLLNAAWAARADAVLILPNDSDTALAAEAAAHAAVQEGLDVRVVPSVAAVQGLAALAVFDPEADADACLTAMTDAALATGHGALTVAAKDAATPAGPCREGQWLGLVGGQIVAVSDDPQHAAAVVLDRLLGAGVELLTAVRGEQGDQDSMQQLLDQVGTGRPDLEVTWVEGGQRAYPWLFGAE